MEVITKDTEEVRAYFEALECVIFLNSHLVHLL